MHAAYIAILFCAILYISVFMNACSEVDRQIRIAELKEQIYAAFQKSIEKEERGENLNANQE